MKLPTLGTLYDCRDQILADNCSLDEAADWLRDYGRFGWCGGQTLWLPHDDGDGVVFEDADSVLTPFVTTADGQRSTVGYTVYIRCGGEYPQPGRWRVREMHIYKIRDGRLRLEPNHPRRVAGCWRLPSEVYASREVAKGPG